ncbi:MAG: PhnD/SsuA/transferrin family substrate-binding protein [Mesosutterella sp.]|nr:PhnD/SsuA/transferrin family substrate-binding protein [Mesosutterella sp.]
MKKHPTTRLSAAALSGTLSAALYTAWAAVLTACLALSLPAAGSEPEPARDPDEILIGVIGSNDLGFRSNTVTPTLQHLEKSLPRYRFRIMDIPAYQALDLIERTRPDFVVGPSDVFFTLINTAGAQALATRKSAWARDGGASVGSAIVVKSNGSAIRTLADLRGKKIAASMPDSLGGWLAFKGELARAGYDPEDFIGGANFLSYEYPAVFESVIDGRSDAGILSACQLESAEASGLLAPGLLRVINEKSDRAIACRRSTDLYPGQTFGVLDFSRPELVKGIALALLSMPPQPTFSWQVAGQFHAVSRLYRDLRIGPFAVKPWTLRDFIARYFWYFAGVLGLALFLVLNEIRLNRLVARRTSALERSLEENRRLADTERQARERLSVLERRSFVSHMGSMIAHELKQPLAAMRNYCEVARIRLEISTRRHWRNCSKRFRARSSA